MKTKSKIDYWKLFKSSRDLITNKNFRNNLGFYNELHNLKSLPKKISWGVL